MEHDDICEVVGEKDIIFCLKSRFEQQNIYVSKALVFHFIVNATRNATTLAIIV